MENIGIDVHKKESQLCILAENGEVIEKRVATSRERFLKVLGARPPARILIEASTESEWVARCLEGMGHEVVVADPSYAPMYVSLSRKVKTDRRDARALADALVTGVFRRAHRISPVQRRVRTQLGVRENLVETRTRLICAIATIVRGEGWRVDPGTTAHFIKRLGDVPLTEEVKAEIQPLVEVLRTLGEQISEADERLERLVEEDALTTRLRTAPGVGPVVAATFVSVVDDAKRFKKAHQLEAYLGLVPSERSSGEKQRKGRITKTGNGRMRRLLVQSALSVMRCHRADAQWLREWANRIATRRGNNIARVALARKLAGVLFAMMRDGTEFRAPPQTPPQAEREAA